MHGENGTVLLALVGAAGQGNAGQPAEALGMCTAFLGVLALLAVWVVLKIGFVGLAVFVDATRPELSARMLHVYRTPGKRPFIVGVLNVVGGGFLILLLLSTGVLGILGLLCLACLVTLAVIGYGAAYHSLGLRVAPVAAKESRTKAIVLGGLVAESAFFVPLVGQVLSLATLFRGLGSVVLALSARHNAVSVQEIPPSPEPPAAG